MWRSLACLGLLAWALSASSAHAQPRGFYPCPNQDWHCLNGKILALENQDRQQTVQLEAALRLVRQYRDELEILRRQPPFAISRDEAWQIAGDRYYFERQMGR